MTKGITVIKCDPEGKEMWRWETVEIERKGAHILLEAVFDLDHSVGGLKLNIGDHFIEHYFADRWYNLFEVYDGDSGQFKGWYCNLSLPAQIGEKELVFRDLALDLIVYPDGRQEEVDWDDFEEMELDGATREAALEGWEELKAMFTQLYKKDPR